MVKHIILWKLKEDISYAEKTEIMKNAKNALESLNGKIDGLKEIHLQTESLSSSNADMMLVSSFDNAESLAGYQKHPLHLAAADNFVRPFTEQRLCLDFEA